MNTDIVMVKMADVVVVAVMDIATAAAVVAADTNFIANSRASKEALKSATLLKSLSLNAIIVGENGVGKTTLAKSIIDSKIIDGRNANELFNALSANSSLIIKNFHKISNYQLLKDALKSNPIRLIATANEDIDEKVVDMFFGLKINLPPLSERLEDVDFLANKFYQEAKHVLLNDEDEEACIDLKTIDLDLSNNAYSLKYSIYKALMIEGFNEDDIMSILEKFLTKRIGSGNDYRDQLYLFDVPLLRAGFKKFHSQLAMSDKFGLNRNTLRKKIGELDTYFDVKNS
ncbi:MAG: Fis family transcriptional regulator [Campylobacteraceae bacterium]